MENIEIANVFISKMDINIHVEGSGKEVIPEAYATQLIDAATTAISSGIEAEYISLEEVDDFYSYIINNLRCQIEQDVSLNKDFEGLTLSFTFTRK